ncbi:autotransporter outer membrane beta-barrel domain-containing protein, partial [Nostoc sp. NIES-2111]
DSDISAADARTVARAEVGSISGQSVPDGILAGTGIVPTTLVLGTLSPDRSIGTLSVAGNLTLQSTATTLIELDPGTGATDRVNVSGTATIGGSLQVVWLGAALPTNGQVFTIIQAGSVAGTYGTVTVTNPLAYFNFAPVYTANQVNLVATQLPFNNTGATHDVRNLMQQSGALDAHAGAGAGKADFNAVLLQLLRLSPGAATNALHSMSGEVYASFT